MEDLMPDRVDDMHWMHPPASGQKAGLGGETPEEKVSVVIGEDGCLQVYVPWNRHDWRAKIKLVEGRCWNSNRKRWCLPMNENTLATLQLSFGRWLDIDHKVTELLSGNSSVKQVVERKASAEKIQGEVSTSATEKTFSTYTQEGKTFRIYTGDQILVEAKDDTRMAVYVNYKLKTCIEIIKNIPGRKWDHDEKHWLVPFDKKTLSYLDFHFGENCKLNLSIPENLPEQRYEEKASEKPGEAMGQSGFGSTADKQGVERKASAEKFQGAVSKSATEKTFSTYTQEGKTFRIYTGDQILVEASGDTRMAVYVNYKLKGYLEVIKNIPGRKWDHDEKCWLVPFDKKTLTYLDFHFGENCKLNLSIPENLPAQRWGKSAEKPKEVMGQPGAGITVGHIDYALNQLENQMRLEGKMQNTIKSYRNHFKQFLLYYSQVEAHQVTASQIKQYLTIQLKEKVIADSTYNQILSALKCYYERVAEQIDKTIKLPRPPKRRKLPNVMSREEVLLILSQIKNLKHKAIVAMMYSCGVRVGEVVKLKYGNLNYDTKRLFVESGKGDKDRYTILPKQMITLLENYRKQYSFKDKDDWIFEGQNGGSYSIRSAQNIVTQAAARARVKRHITAHSFRHAFTTHMHSFGYSVEQIRLWLGHAAISTTQGYLHLGLEDNKGSKSPFDEMDI